MKKTNYLKEELYELIKTDESIFDFIQESSLDGLWYWDLEHPEEEWMNPKFWAVLGYDHREMPHKASAWQDIIHPEDLKIAIDSVTKHFENPDCPYDQTVRYTHKNGSTVWIRCRGMAIRDKDGKPLRMLGAHQEITELKSSEKKLQNEHHKLEAIATNSPDLLILVDEHQKVQYINKVLPGFNRGKVIGDDVLNYVFPDYRKAYQQWLLVVFSTGEPLVRQVKAVGEHGVEALYQVTFTRINQYEEGNLVYIVAKDITEKTRIELDNQDLTKHLKYALDASGDGIWDWTPADGKMVYSKAWIDMLGYEEGELASLASEWSDRLHPDDAEWVFAAINKVTQTPENGDTVSHEYRFKNKAGDYLWILNKAKVVERNENGEASRVVGTHTNITDRKKAELGLQESEKKFRELFENLIDEVHLWKIIKDKTAKITGWQLVDANPSALKSWGKSINDVIGKTANEIFGADAHAQFMPMIEEIFTTGKSHKWEQHFPPTDQFLQMESIPFGDYFISTGKDITATKKENQHSKLLESVITHTKDAVLITEAGPFDEPGPKIIYVNEAFTQMTGYTAEEVIGKTPRILQGPNSDKEALAKLSKAIRKWEPCEMTIINYKKSGEEFWINFSLTPVSDEKGWYTHWISIDRDVTEQKKVELELIKAKEQAEAANKAKSEFLANMSHEIRTPLNGVIGFTELLTTTPLNPVQQQYANSANVSGHTLLGIINDILDFSKIEAGMLELEEMKTDMVALLENSIDIVKFSAVDKEIELLLDIDPTMPRFAQLDAIRTKQILANLLSNAVKFTQKGEVALKAVYQALDGHQGKLSISVRDTGIGITEEQKVKLFKSFSQADSSTTRKYGGTGLGLVISQLIAEKMGSKINLDSTPDVSTTFYFDIITDFEEGEKPDATQITGVKRCLIIDDNDNNRLILEQMLKQWQIESDSCNSGLAALQKLQNYQPYDVVICDYDMPYLNGIETIRLMTDQLKLSTEKQPVILLHSSLDNPELNQKSKELGIRFHLNKPVKRQDLFTHLSHLDQTTETIPQNEAEQTVNASETSGKIKILIAEDNPLNMVLSKTIISQQMPNSEVYEAKNGLEAFEQYKSISPDLIFMDVHMPELDGIEVTQKIRAFEVNTSNHIPIIALTAGALKEEKEKCLAAGMDDFLTKPLESTKIQSVLSKFFKHGKKINADLQNKDAKNHIHFGFSELIASIGNNMEMAQILMSLLLTDMPSQIGQLEQACNEMDFAKIKKIAHSIKGNFLTMRCNILADISEKIENAGKDISFENLHVQLTELKQEWKTVKSLLLQKMDH